MKRHLATFVILLSATGHSAAQSSSEQFPYTAFAAAKVTAVRSGPGDRFYPVLELKHGDAVEVWRHDAGGWCAIRPPEGSFSWIAADFVTRQTDRLGVIAGSQVNVRVGTQFSDVRDAVQIQLNDGEQVELLEAKQLTTGDRTTWWYKIAPPAGEFRFIHQSQLVTHPSELAAAAAAMSPTAPKAEPGTIQRASYTAPVEGADDGSADTAAAELRRMRPEESIDAHLAQMEVVLSRQVAAEPTTWSFQELQQQGERLLERAETAVERSQVRLFLGKLERFEDIRQRYGRFAETRTQTDVVDDQLRRTSGEAPMTTPTVAAARRPESATPAQTGPATAAFTASTPARTAPPADVSRYDGVGRLTQLVLSADGKPTYALSDDRGELVAYVTAAPGVNLRQYVGLDVGINGIKGFLTDERIAQLTAKRIDVLTARGEPLRVQRR